MINVVTKKECVLSIEVLRGLIRAHLDSEGVITAGCVMHVEIDSGLCRVTWRERDSENLADLASPELPGLSTKG